ncbi:MAG: helix-hairpin-helix domain-containing protein [Chthoniobacterales bacterium]
MLATPAALADEWEVLEDCRLVRGAYADGDSFHVSHRGKDYIFRFYFVDTPETDRQIPSRVREQAEHFGVDEDAVLEFGDVAAEFTAAALRGRSFTVHTQWEDARGASRQPRYYAHIVFDRGGEEINLANELVANGLARSYGMRGAPPEWPASGRIEQQLDLLEGRARRGKVGIYGRDPRRVGRAEPTPTPWRIDALQSEGQSSEVSSQAGLPGVGVSSSGRISVNAADADTLETVPGVGPVIAGRIIDARPFDSIEDLRRVKGIGAATLDRMRGSIGL